MDPQILELVQERLAEVEQREDVRKALILLRKSNPPLLEWLQSPLIYCEKFSGAARMRASLPVFYSPVRSFHHYLHMAQGNYREYLHGELVWRKKYFYVLRPLLALIWIERGLGPVPMEFQRLVDETVSDAGVHKEIGDLTAAKRAGAELDRGPAIPILSEFIGREIARFAESVAERQHAAPAIEPLNELFRATLDEVWRRSSP